jgi:hypothetical protein
MELDDRRFSPIELTEKKLTQAYGPDWFDEFNYHVDDLADKSPLVAQFGQWILKHGEDKSIARMAPYKEEKFKEIVNASLRKWQDHTLEILEDFSNVAVDNGAFTTYEKLRNRYNFKFKDSGQYPKKQKVIEFLKAYESSDTNCKIVEVFYINNKEQIVPVSLLDQYKSGYVEVKPMGDLV